MGLEGGRPVTENIVSPRRGWDVCFPILGRLALSAATPTRSCPLGADWSGVVTTVV